MSHAAIVAREENRDGIIRRRNSAVNSNMVTIMKDNISVRSIENYRSTDSQVGIVSFPCDFDHMYASMTEGMVASKEKNKYKYLKEICLQHLDLIQQQSEIIAKQEKQIQSLRLENGKLKHRILRSDRRSGLQKLDSDNEEGAMKVGSSDPLLSRCQRSANTTKGPKFRGIASLSSLERLNSPVQWRRSAQCRQSEDGGASAISEGETYDSSTTTMSQRSTQHGKRTAGPNRKRPRAKRSVSSASREIKINDEALLDMSEDRSLKRTKTETDVSSEGGISQASTVLTTCNAYHTATGSTDSEWTLNETCIETEPEPDFNGDVLETPQWRVKVFSSLYSMEGTENLDDEVFLKRHHRLEVDERRRKRWDVQRIRELRHIDKLKQRELSSNVSGGTSKGNASTDVGICSLWPNPEDAEYLQVDEELPVAAFGIPLTNYAPSEFSLPWVDLDSQEEPQPAASQRRRNQRRNSGSIRRKRMGRRGGGRSSLPLPGRRADPMEKK